MVDQYAREVEDFRFIPLKDEWGTRGSSQNERRLRVTIGINGWLGTKDDVTKPWRTLGDDSEAFALRYEMKSLLGLGKTLQDLVSSYAWNSIKVEILKRTVLATLWSALWPAYLLSMASAVDNPFSLAKNRSEKAGEILADALINKVQGERPVTLIGYSLGARVIYSCLRSLAARRAFGLVDTVVFIGAPVPSNKQHWQIMRTVVSGKMFNVYSENDYLLAFLYRATSIQLGVAGLQEIKDIEGVENLNLSGEVQGHMRYAKLIGKILARCGVPVTKGADGPIEEDEDAIKLDDRDKNKGDLIELDGLHITDAPEDRQSQPPPVYTATPEPQHPPPMYQLRNKQRTTVTRAKPSAVAVNQDLLGLDLSDIPLPGPSAPPQPAQPAARTPPQPQQQAPKPAQPAPSARFSPKPTMPNNQFDRPQPAPSARFGPRPTLPSPPSNQSDRRPQPKPNPAPAPNAPSAAPIRSASTLSAPAAPPSQMLRGGPSPEPASHPVLTSSHSYNVGDHYGNDDDGDDSDEEGGGGMGIKMVDNDDEGDGGLEFCEPTPLDDEQDGGGYSSWR